MRISDCSSDVCSSDLQTHAKAGMASGRIPRRRNDRRGSILYAPALGKLEAWLALPRELALGRLAYALKRPLFTLPQAPWRWHEHPPAAAALVQIGRAHV